MCVCIQTDIFVKGQIQQTHVWLICIHKRFVALQTTVITKGKKGNFAFFQ